MAEMGDKLQVLKEKTLLPGKCAFILPGGHQCMQDVGPAYTHCIWHDDERKAEAAAARVKGGMVSTRKKYIPGTKIPIEGLDEVLDGLGEVLHNLQQLAFTPAVANSMIRALQVASACYLDKEERDIILQQIEELEKAVEELD